MNNCWDINPKTKEHMKGLNLNQKKVEALQEKWVASIMMHNEEYNDARKKLLSAQLLYPQLDNINPMLKICEILLLASSVKISNNDIDSHCILDLIYPSATNSDAIKNLHDLVISMNGVKDEFPGAELALEFVQNALNVLADREKQFHHHGFSQDSDLISSNEISASTTLVRCSDCSKSNLDVQLEQGILEKSIEVDQDFLQQEFYNFEEERSVSLFEPGQIWGVHYQPDEVKQCHRYAKIKSVMGDVVSVTWLKPIVIGAGERKGCNAGFPVACGSFCLNLNACDEVKVGAFSYKCSWACGQMNDHVEIYPKRGEIWALYVAVNEFTCNPEALEGCKFQLIEMLSDYSKCSGGGFACLEKVNGFHSVFKRVTCGSSNVVFHLSPNCLFLSHRIPAYRLMGGEDEVLFELDQMALPNNLVQHTGATNPIKDSVGKFQSEDEFLKYKISADDFVTGQVWAIYCGEDIMPREYALVNSVVSETQVWVTILEPELIHEYENQWREDPPIVCGRFKHSNVNVMLDMSQFSHLVKCVHVQGTIRPHYMIHPQKGEIWAMYKNWNRKWENTDYEDSQYWMVEIISDFSEKNGIKVAKLEEVQNCITFFHRQRHQGVDITRAICEAEMLSFSHQVLAYKVPGIESYGIPEDSWHLVPNAIPYQQNI